MNREEVTNSLISRVLQNVPLSELIRVYSESLRASLEPLTDEELLESIASAGYTDIIEAQSLTDEDSEN
jgi:hypothetical protein